jgi:hypothetical protein
MIIEYSTDMLRSKCLEAPNEIGHYRELAHRQTQDTARLAWYGGILFVLGGEIWAAAILRLLRRRRDKAVRLSKYISEFTAILSKGRFPISAVPDIDIMLQVSIENGAVPAYLYPYFRMKVFDRTGTDQARKIFISILRSRQPWRSSDLLRAAQILSKFRDPQAIAVMKRLLENKFMKQSRANIEWFLEDCYLYVISEVRGAQALKDAVDEVPFPSVRDAYKSKYESLYLFATGERDAAVFAGAGSTIGAKSGMIFNGVRLYPTQARARSIVQNISTNKNLPEAPRSPRNVAIVVSCDPVYLEVFGKSYVENLQPPPGITSAVFISLIGEVDEKIIINIQKSSPIPVHIVTDPQPTGDVSTYTLRRFIEIPTLIRDYDLVVATDIDAAINLREVEFFDQLSAHCGGWLESDNVVPWLKHCAGLVYFSRTQQGDLQARRLAALADSLRNAEQSGYANWYIDQVCLSVLWDLIPDEFKSRFHLLRRSLVDGKFLNFYDGAGFDPRRRLERKIASLQNFSQ